MIFIKKPDSVPPKLIEFQTAMRDSIGTHGSFERIPDEELNAFKNGYRHVEVKEALFNCSHQKCSYCEAIPTGSSLRVDHFFPKKLYPEFTLDWNNLYRLAKTVIQGNRHMTPKMNQLLILVK